MVAIDSIKARRDYVSAQLDEFLSVRHFPCLRELIDRDIPALLNELDEALGIIDYLKDQNERMTLQLDEMAPKSIVADRDRWKARCEAMERAIRQFQLTRP